MLSAKVYFVIWGLQPTTLKFPQFCCSFEKLVFLPFFRTRLLLLGRRRRLSLWLCSPRIPLDFCFCCCRTPPSEINDVSLRPSAQLFLLSSTKLAALFVMLRRENERFSFFTTCAHPHPSIVFIVDDDDDDEPITLKNLNKNLLSYSCEQLLSFDIPARFNMYRKKQSFIRDCAA